MFKGVRSRRAHQCCCICSAASCDPPSTDCTSGHWSLRVAYKLCLHVYRPFTHPVALWTAPHGAASLLLGNATPKDTPVTTTRMSIAKLDCKKLCKNFAMTLQAGCRWTSRCLAGLRCEVNSITGRKTIVKSLACCLSSNNERGVSHACEMQLFRGAWPHAPLLTHHVPTPALATSQLPLPHP